MISVPFIRAVDVGRQQGILVVRSAEELNVDVQKSLGLLQMDASELPQILQQQKWDFAYRLSTSNYELALSAEKILPRVTATSFMTLLINSIQEKLSLQVMNDYQVERAGVFQFFCDIPEGFEVNNVRIAGGKLAKALQIDSYHLSNEVDANGMRRLTINLSRKVLSELVIVELDLTKPFSEPDLQSATGKTIDFNIQLPTVPEETVQRREGFLAICTDNAIRSTPTNLHGIQTIPVRQFMIRWRQDLKNPLTHTLVFGQEQPSLVLQAERRKPHITALQLLRMQIENGVVKYTDLLNYDVQFGGVKNVRIDIPESIADKVRVVRSFQKTKMTPQPDDVEKGFVAFTFDNGNELRGKYIFELTWEEELKQLEVGKKIPISVPQLVPKAIDRSSGHIVISKAPSIDLREESSSGLRSVDPQHDIPANERTANTAAAFEFFGKWSLELAAVRYQSEELKKTSLEEGLLQLVSVRSSENLTARALYRIRTVKQRLGLALPENAIVNDVRINGKVVALESGGQDAGQYLIPLNSVVPDTAFLLELRYMYPGSIRNIEIPLFPGETLHEREDSEDQPGPAIQDMAIAVYIPDDDVITDFQGPWTPHFSFTYDYPMTVVSNGEWSPDQLVQKVRNGINDAGMPTAFPVAGSVYVFSALQPGAAPTDTLRLSSAWERGVRAVVFSSIMLVGFVLCPFTWRWRFTIGLLFVIASCVVGIFFPTLTMYVSEHDIFAQAIFWVVLLWCCVSLFRFVRTARKNFFAQRAVEPPQPQPVQTQPVTANAEGGNES